MSYENDWDYGNYDNKNEWDTKNGSTQRWSLGEETTSGEKDNKSADKTEVTPNHLKEIKESIEKFRNETNSNFRGLAKEFSSIVGKENENLMQVLVLIKSFNENLKRRMSEIEIKTSGTQEFMKEMNKEINAMKEMIHLNSSNNQNKNQFKYLESRNKSLDKIDSHSNKFRKESLDEKGSDLISESNLKSSGDSTISMNSCKFINALLDVKKDIYRTLSLDKVRNEIIQKYKSRHDEVWLKTQYKELLDSHDFKAKSLIIPAVNDFVKFLIKESRSEVEEEFESHRNKFSNNRV
jgi:hypothetical protein